MSIWLHEKSRESLSGTPQESICLDAYNRSPISSTCYVWSVSQWAEFNIQFDTSNKVIRERSSSSQRTALVLITNRALIKKIYTKAGASWHWVNISVRNLPPEWTQPGHRNMGGLSQYQSRLGINRQCINHMSMISQRKLMTFWGPKKQRSASPMHRRLWKDFTF